MKRLVTLFAVLLLAAGALAAWFYWKPPGAAVPARGQTEPVPHDGDAADDAAIWVDPDDPARSLILCTDKDGGLALHDLDGALLQYVGGTPTNNVDVRDGFPLGDRTVPLVAASGNDDHCVLLFRIDPAARRLVPLDPPRFAVGIDAAGLCLARDPASGRTFVIVTGDSPGKGEEDGLLEQWELVADAAGKVTATPTRGLDVGGTIEGCVADDELGHLFVAEEEVGIWRYGLLPETHAERTLVARVGLRGKLRYQVEGLAIADHGQGRGYLIASSQGSNDFVVLRREGAHEYVGRFRVIAHAGIDAVNHTDGIAVTAAPLGPRYPRGVFIAQDDDNGDENQNFKLASWAEVLEAIAPPKTPPN